MHRVLHPRSYSWLSLAFLVLASGCPASPPDVSLRADSGPGDLPDARMVDAGGPDRDAPGPAMDGGGPGPDARPDTDAGEPGGIIREYGWPPTNTFTEDLDYPADLVILQRITVVAPGELSYLGTIVNGLSGTTARLGLYQEVDGEPRTLVADTGPFTTVLGLNQQPPLTPVNLAAGNYWTAVILSAPTVLATSDETRSNLRLADVPFLSAYPQTLASSSQTDAPDINVYIGILEP